MWRKSCPCKYEIQFSSSVSLYTDTQVSSNAYVYSTEITVQLLLSCVRYIIQLLTNSLNDVTDNKSLRLEYILRVLIFN